MTDYKILADIMDISELEGKKLYKALLSISIEKEDRETRGDLRK